MIFFGITHVCPDMLDMCTLCVKYVCPIDTLGDLYLLCVRGISHMYLDVAL